MGGGGEYMGGGGEYIGGGGEYSVEEASIVVAVVV